MRFFLTGFMGSGKSYTGRKLAEHWALPFVDLDDYLEEKEGRTIRQIFAEEGEAYFREKEKQCLHEMYRFSSAIIATGGGTPCFFDNMDWMNERGVSVFLETPVEVIVQRLLPELQKRPLLQGYSEKDLALFIDKKLAERRPFYEKAQLVYQQKTADEDVAENLVTYMRRFF